MASAPSAESVLGDKTGLFVFWVFAVVLDRNRPCTKFKPNWYQIENYGNNYVIESVENLKLEAENFTSKISSLLKTLLFSSTRKFCFWKHLVLASVRTSTPVVGAELNPHLLPGFQNFQNLFQPGNYWTIMLKLKKCGLKFAILITKQLFMMSNFLIFIFPKFSKCF